LWEVVARTDGVPWPDHLIFPILFLLHQYFELELKGSIALTVSIGNASNKAEGLKDIHKTHDLPTLVALLGENLKRLTTVPQTYRLSQETKDFLEDLNKFGALGEALRFPYHTLSKGAFKEIGFQLPDALIPDMKAVMEKTEAASKEFTGLVSALMEIDDLLNTRLRESEHERPF
jgi:hypothetical protein